MLAQVNPIVISRSDYCVVQGSSSSQKKKKGFYSIIAHSPIHNWLLTPWATKGENGELGHIYTILQVISRIAPVQSYT